MTTSRSPYNKVPVDQSTRSIRLICQVKKSRLGDHGWVLRAFRLDSCPSYIALSYTWGPNEPTHDFIGIAVRENLWLFLEQMKLSKQKHWFWIDAICIDQSNVAERNHQVQMMRSIYSQASQVTVWLGKYSSDIDGSFCYLEDVLSDKNNALSLYIWNPVLKKSILNFLNGDYWRRVWIIQEIVLARHIIIQCGAKRLAWDRLEYFFSRLIRCDETGRSRYMPGASDMLACAAFRVYIGRMDWPALRRNSGMDVLLSLLALYNDQECSDVRDRIYGYLGLLESVDTDGDRPAITVDYSLPASAIFTQCYQKVHAVYEPDRFRSTMMAIEILQKALRLSASDPAVLEAKEDSRTRFKRPQLLLSDPSVPDDEWAAILSGTAGYIAMMSIDAGEMWPES